MNRALKWMGCGCLLVACGGTGAEGEPGSDSSSSSGSGSSATMPAVSTSGSSSSPSGSTSSGSTTSGTSLADGSSGDTRASESVGGDTETDTGTGLDANGCPASAPSSWVSCESFDDVVDPAQDLSQWNVNGDTIGIDVLDDGTQALRLTLTPGQQFGGWVTLRFGLGPDAPAIDSPDGRYDEVWVRYQLKMDDDWPGGRAGDVGEVISMNGAHWGIAADLNIQADGMQRIHPFAWTCIFDGVQACDGQNDWGGTLQSAWNAPGSSILFDADAAGRWQCIEAHMRLNDLGQSNGEAHVWVDGLAEVTREDLDWRGTWDEFGINAVRFTNFAPPPPEPRSFFIDDVVVATERVGCEGRR